MTAREGYRILKVSPRASWEEIRSRFRALVYACHPDRNPDNPEAAAQFRRVVEAYESIRAARARSRKRRQQYRQAEFKVKDDLFEEYFGISGTAPQACTSGPDFRYDLQISFMAAMQGLETTIQVPQVHACPHCNSTGQEPHYGSRTCPDCQGTGRRPLGPGMLRLRLACQRCQGLGQLLESPCRVCQGSGYQKTFRHYHLKIPPGTKDGTRLRFVGEGGRGFHNGPPGNLEVVISVEPHSFFTRKGNDLHCKLEISFAKAALGGTIRVPTLNGFRSVYVPPGTSSGKVLRFPGLGVPAGPGQAAGDQIVELVVTTPAGITPRQREILEEFRRLEQQELSFAAHE
ncbi:MAG: DnaJ domain-containing protein [Deltaproteobacteria bacterium]|nr:DnaJ domain-containing protein [Deltaproteobacteria bacterium]